MSKGQKTTSFFVAIAFLHATIFLNGCRKEVEDDARLEEVTWYNSFGEPEPCGPTVEACESAVDAREFIDLCVEKGFSAKSCGCTVLCSGPVNYGSITAASLTFQDAGADQETCDSASQSAITTLQQVAASDGPLGTCLDNFLCRGDPRSCQGEAMPQAQRLRQLARDGCRDEVLSTFCDADFVESLNCADTTINTLAKAHSDHILGESALKTCLQNDVCSSRPEACGAADLEKTNNIRDMLLEPGCDYWFQDFCRL